MTRYVYARTRVGNEFTLSKAFDIDGWAGRAALMTYIVDRLRENHHRVEVLPIQLEGENAMSEI